MCSCAKSHEGQHKKDIEFRDGYVCNSCPKNDKKTIDPDNDLERTWTETRSYKVEISCLMLKSQPSANCKCRIIRQIAFAKCMVQKGKFKDAATNIGCALEAERACKGSGPADTPVPTD